VGGVSDAVPGLEVDQVAAALRADSGDLHQFAEVLAGKLEQALPGRTRVERRRSGLRGPKHVRRVVLALDDTQLELAIEGGRVTGTRAHMSGGIALKREMLDLDEWVLALSEKLTAEASRSERARAALANLLM
jgi:hypothetical protein